MTHPTVISSTGILPEYFWGPSCNTHPQAIAGCQKEGNQQAISQERKYYMASSATPEYRVNVY